MTYRLVNQDCIEWLSHQEPCSIEAVVTDPPYGVEYEPWHLERMRAGSGGSWRVPPPNRKAVPRFTTLTKRELSGISRFFLAWASLLDRVLVPGAHVIIASNPLVSQHVWNPLLEAGFEKRGEIVRLVQTLRGGDRPKNSENEFPDVTVIPRSGWEPWGVFRKPLDGTVAETLRKWGTGGLRRESLARPFTDVIKSAVASREEARISSHPSLKPQAFMRAVVRAALPLGEGTILDPFMGSGSTIAAAEYWGYKSIGVERDSLFYNSAQESIPKLAKVSTDPLARDLFDTVMELDA